MDQSRRLGQTPSLVREHQEVWEVGLRLLRVDESFHRNHDHAGAAPGEVLVTSFELNQLEHAERSPLSAKETSTLFWSPSRSPG
jgi:hypothetical protein